MNPLLPLLVPVLSEVWTAVIMPELQKLEGQISSADLKLIAQTFTDALNKIAQAEIPKL